MLILHFGAYANSLLNQNWLLEMVAKLCGIDENLAKWTCCENEVLSETICSESNYWKLFSRVIGHKND